MGGRVKEVVVGRIWSELCWEELMRGTFGSVGKGILGS